MKVREMFRLRILICLAITTLPAAGSEADALAISAKIQARFLPFGTILEPVYASATSDQIAGYTDCGDSALWTGAYLEIGRASCRERVLCVV